MKSLSFVLLSLMCVFFYTACSDNAFTTTPKLIFKNANIRYVYKSDLTLYYVVEDKEGDIASEIFLFKKFLNKNKKIEKSSIQQYSLPSEIPLTENLSANIELKLSYNFDINQVVHSPLNDTIKFGAYLIDLNGNKSDTCYSDTIFILSKPNIN